MTKQQEIDALQAFIKTIPRDSYIVPMLVGAMPMIEQDMQSDFEPDLTAYIRDLHRQKQELEEQIKVLRKEISNGNDTVKRQKSETEYLSRQSEQLKKQFRGLQESLKTVLQW